MNEDKEKETFTHPSFGQIRFSRVQGHAEFYGSELAQDHYIVMEVKQSEVQRTLTCDWNFAHGLPLIELRMSSMQFSELITSLNQGSGVPCTIEMLDKKKVEQYPVTESRKEFVHRKFKERMLEFTKTLREKQNRVKELTAKKTLSKADQSELNFLVEWLTTEVANNIPFFAECFQETMDEVVMEAKMEVENAIQHKITTLGLEELHKQNGVLSIKQEGSEGEKK